VANPINGQVVSQHLNLFTPSTIQPQPPRYGRVIDDTTPTAPEILWDDAEQSTITAAAVSDLALDVIETPATAALAAANTKFIGQTVIRISSDGAKPGDPSGGTSREFAGQALSVYMRTPIQDAPGTGTITLVVCSNGLFFEDAATEFVVLQSP
jgi:hypothetical protein